MRVERWVKTCGGNVWFPITQHSFRPFCLGKLCSMHPMYFQSKQKPQYHFPKLYLHSWCWHVTQALPVRLNSMRLQFRHGQHEQAETEQNPCGEDVAIKESSFQSSGMEILPHMTATSMMAFMSVATVVSRPSR